jgi:hypothetical protein
MEHSKQIKIVHSLTGNVIINITFTQDMELVDIKDKLIEINGDNIYYTLEYDGKIIDWTMSNEDFTYFTNYLKEITINVTYTELSIICIPFFHNMFIFHRETEELELLTNNKSKYSSLVYGHKILITYENETTNTCYTEIYDIICKNSYLLFDDISIVKIKISENGKVALIQKTSGINIHSGIYIHDATKKYFPEINKITDKVDLHPHLTISHDGSIVSAYDVTKKLNIWNTLTGEIINTLSFGYYTPYISFDNTYKKYGYRDNYGTFMIEGPGLNLDMGDGNHAPSVISWSSNELLVAYYDLDSVNIYSGDISSELIVSLYIEHDAEPDEIEIKFSNDNKYLYVNIYFFDTQMYECKIYKTDTWISYINDNISIGDIIDTPWKQLYYEL